jgi:hypothetical protein
VDQGCHGSHGLRGGISGDRAISASYSRQTSVVEASGTKLAHRFANRCAASTLRGAFVSKSNVFFATGPVAFGVAGMVSSWSVRGEA